MLSHWGERKTNDISCFRFGSCMYTSVWVWWAYFHGLCAVHQNMVNSTSTLYNGKYMLNPLGDFGALTFIEPVCIFAVKTTLPTRKIDPVSMSSLTYLHAASSAHVVDSNCRTLFQYPMILRRLILRSRKFSKQRDLYLELCDCSEIWRSCTSAAVLQMCLSNFRAIL